ncbi:DUF3237 domain-containing protein [Paenibacillus sp. FSL R7-0345]|uniref:DUF3237 domain-containing protein n=1 Tax=Paenibacillus sp. FSL R7-0345 TaxID=2954535 RepID=UPI00315AAFDA
MLLEAELVLELTVELGETLDVGNTPNGFLRLIPITGGGFAGPEIKGRILPGGYDWNTTLNDGRAHAFAKYALQTDDGVYISIENEGYLSSGIHNSAIQTTPRFQVTDGKYDWLRSGVFAGSLEAGQTEVPSVCIKIYKLK